MPDLLRQLKYSNVKYSFRYFSCKKEYYTIASLAITAILLSILFLYYDLKTPTDFILSLRAGKLLTLWIVAYSIAISTILFQTITHNRILTPAIMGCDQLYLLIQTILVFITGSFHFGTLSNLNSFLINSVFLVFFSGTIFQYFFTKKRRSLYLALLVGIILGTLFRSISVFLQRILDPNAFVVLQNRLFASFNHYDSTILTVAYILVVVISLLLWQMRSNFDVLALGRDFAINLGVSYKRTITLLLFLIMFLVAVSTALVGPITFFGLLIASLAYQLTGTERHSIILPIATLLSIIFLVGGQFLLERLFHLNGTLSILIEFVGGILFILLLFKGKIH